MPRSAARHAIIVGGGASGVLLAYQLLHNQLPDFRVTLIEKRAAIGRGLAYHTGNPEHLLNVRVANMSALPDDPEHFWRWIAARRPERPLCPDPYCFVSRSIYGDYIESLVVPFIAGADSARGLAIVRGDCVAISDSAAGVTVMLADGSSFIGDIAILATGHDLIPPKSIHHVDPWASPRAAGVGKDVPVLILGTGLSMVDYLLALLHEGHRGPIVAMSRRGLLPRPHRRVGAAPIAETDVPFGASISTLTRWLRARVAQHEAQGGDWRSVLDGIRPFTQRIWRELPLASRRRFLEHARAWWDVHRHRTAPEVDGRVADALAAGQLKVLAGKITRIEPDGAGAVVHYRPRGNGTNKSIPVGAIVDCTGIVRDPRASANPAVQSLLEQGLARVDPLRIGIEVDAECAIVGQDGSPSERLFAVGPLTRAAAWEIIAIPDIRGQCAELAARLRGRRARG